MTPIFVPKDRKSLFRQFLGGMYDAVVITDPNGHILEINPRAKEFFGYEEEELVDRPVSLLVPGLAAAVVQRIRCGLEADRHIIVDANGRAKDGTKFACEIAVSVIDLADPDDLVFTIRNIERRRKVRDMLRAKENAFRLAREALFVCDASGTFTYVNPAFCEMFGFAAEEEAREHAFAELMPDEPLPANFRKALAGEKTTVDIVSEVEDSDASEEIVVTLAPNMVGRKVRGVVGSIVRSE